MGTLSRMEQEMDEVDDILNFFKDIFKNSELSNYKKNKSLRAINNLSNANQVIDNHNYRYEIKNKLYPEYKKLNKNPNLVDSILPDVSLILDYLNNRIVDNFYYNKKNSINSENYYNNRISELEKRESELKKALNFNKNENEEKIKEAEDIRKKLLVIEKELNQKKKELEIKKKQEDAKNDWEEKINETFGNLKEYLVPIEMEHSRLNILYYVYAFLCIIALIAIVLSEIILIVKIAKSDILPVLNDYIIILLPLPIAAALMWGFIFQMNRAQRQLILTSNKIHNIKYIQGLLLSINNLSPDINDGITRVNNALDKIISNHLNYRNVHNEIDLINEENKDNLPFDKILELVKVAKK